MPSDLTPEQRDIGAHRLKAGMRIFVGWILIGCALTAWSIQICLRAHEFMPTVASLLLVSFGVTLIVMPAIYYRAFWKKRRSILAKQPDDNFS
jgi:hypothetical protein